MRPFVNITKDSFSLFAGSISKTVGVDDPDYAKLVALYKAGDDAGLENYLTEVKNKVENKYKKFGFSVNEGRVQIGDEFLPTSLSNRLVTHADQNLPVDRLLKFWEKLKENSSHRSVNALFDFMEKNHLPLTVDGDVVAYKAVRNDFKDKHSGTIDNTPGVRPPKKFRRDCDDDSRTSCSKGYHVGGFSYVQNFGSGDDRYIEVSFNPADVISVPFSSYEDKIRVCDYLPVREIKKEEVVNYTQEHYDLPDVDDDDHCPDCGEVLFSCFCEEDEDDNYEDND